MRTRHARTGRVAVALAAALLAAGCAGGGTDPAGDGAPVDPGEGWVADTELLDADAALIAAHAVDHDLAWQQGVAAGTAFLAEHTWPDGYTAEGMQRCRFGDPVPDLAELDADGLRVTVGFSDLEPAPDWRFRPLDVRVADDGLRVYRVVQTEEVVSGGEVRLVHTGVAHVGVADDGRVVRFPVCVEYLPGGRPDVQRDLDRSFGDLGPESFATACAAYQNEGAEAALAMFTDGGWDLTIVEVRTAFLDWCGPVWDEAAGLEPAAPGWG